MIKLFIKQSFQRKKSLLKRIKYYKFPWWFKLVVYILSFGMAAVSIFFIIVKGIEFGDEKVQKWLSAIIVSLICSILLTQPIKVINIKLILLMI